MNFSRSKCKIVNNTRNTLYLGQNTSKYCSQIIVVYVHAHVFSRIHPACHNIVNSIKPGSDSRKTDKHAVDCSKAVCWGITVKFYVRCIKCSYNNVAKGICLLDKNAFFVYTGKISCK